MRIARRKQEYLVPPSSIAEEWWSTRGEQATRMGPTLHLPASKYFLGEGDHARFSSLRKAEELFYHGGFFWSRVHMDNSKHQ